MGSVVHMRAASAKLAGLAKIAQDLYVMCARSMARAPPLATVSVHPAGLVKGASIQSVNARTVASVLHLTPVSARLSGQVTSVQ